LVTFYDVAHYFEEQPETASRPGSVTLVLPDLHLKLATDSGMFSPERVDQGTRILLESVPPPPPGGDLLDLGCGYGPIALAVALACPGATVDAVDVNERALALCRDNAQELGVAARIRVLRPEDADPSARYDEIWSNPPIRIGKAALHELLLTWLARLAPAGVARLVVARNLGADTLQRWLAEQGYAVERAASSKGFRVLVVHQVRPG
jgi:16S rRNA (guanine1207-N2)-methyltransferase